MPELQPELTLDPDTAFYILLKAREFDVKQEAADPDEGSNPADDRAIDVLEFQPDDVVETELAAAIKALNEDERLDLIALSWIGRGDFDFDQWAEAREGARDVEPARTTRYLLGMPGLSDDLEEALSRLGYSLSDYIDTRLPGPDAPRPESGVG